MLVGVTDLDLGQLRALAAVVDQGSLDAAARVLHVTPSAVSQRLRALEVAAGRVLLVRSRPARVTASGEVLLRLARQVDLLAADAAAELGVESASSGPSGPGGLEPAPVLPIAVNADSLATWVLPALAPLGDRVCLDLRREDQERTAALLRDGSVVAAVTADAAPVPGCSSSPLGAMRYVPAASAALARRWFGDGRPTAGWTSAPVVVFDRDDDLQDAHLRAVAPGSRPPRHHVPSSADFLAAVRLGMGWGMVPTLQAAGLLATGELVGLDPDGAVDVALHWQRWRLGSPGLDAVDAAVTAAAARHLEPPPG